MTKRLAIFGTSLVLVFCLLLGISSCSMKIYAQNLMEGYKASPRPTEALKEDTKAAMLDAYAALAEGTLCTPEGGLVSPLSVVAALTMAVIGAEGDTLAQMEAALGCSRDELLSFFSSYIASLEGDALKLAFSVWLNETALSVNDRFLQTNADYLGADVYAAPFDSRTLEDINRWVKQNTDRMIDKILDSLDAQTVMCLINALAFDAEWETKYEKSQIGVGGFTDIGGNWSETTVMHSTEGLYLDTDDAIGFIKYYEGRDYAFVALLPKEEGADALYDLVRGLDGASLSSLLSSAENRTVRATMPAFERDSTFQLNQVLTQMGMTDAFDPALANFSGMGTAGGNLYLSDVLHKTYIEVSATGTRAAAVTAITVKCTSLAPPDDTVSVVLDRPFFYMIVDTSTGMPLFMGTLTSAN